MIFSPSLILLNVCMMAITAYVRSLGEKIENYKKCLQFHVK